jgi:ADP-heptose:LPS heptosyltransferase
MKNRNLLFLRSYGDFIVGLHFIKELEEQFAIHASTHLEPLYKAVQPFIPQNNIHFFDVNIKRGIFSGFTNKFLFSRQTFIEAVNIKKYIQHNQLEQIFFEQPHFLNKTLSSKSSFINISDNVYTSYANLTNKKINYTTDINPINEVVIFSDSRKKEKELSSEIINSLANRLSPKFKVTFARFTNAVLQRDNEISYSNFFDLVNIINNTSYVISSDSLPLHLASLLNKPHACIYNKIINKAWLTPYMENNKSFFLKSEIDKIVAL